jgi:hypothetical protein
MILQRSLFSPGEVKDESVLKAPGVAKQLLGDLSLSFSLFLFLSLSPSP